MPQVVFSVAAVVVNETFCHKVVVVVMVKKIVMMICIPTSFFLPGLLSKTMSNRAQNLHLSRVLMPY